MFGNTLHSLRALDKYPHSVIKNILLNGIKNEVQCDLGCHRVINLVGQNCHEACVSGGTICYM